MLEECYDFIVICEGEPDRLSIISKGIPAVTSTHGVATVRNVRAAIMTSREEIFIPKLIL